MQEIILLRDACGGSVVVGIGETMTGRPVAAAIARFNREHSDVQLRLIEDYTERLVPRLSSNEVDLVVGGPSYALEDSGDFEIHHLFDVEDVLAVRREHPLAGRAAVDMAELARYPWIVPGARNDVFRQIQIVYSREGVRPPQNILRSDAVAVGTWLCLDNDYIICVSPDMIGSLEHVGLVTTIDCPGLGMMRHACLFTRRPAQLAPAAELLMAEILLEVRRTRV